MTETTAGLTPSQTVGPFLHIGLPWPDGPDVVPEGTPGAIVIAGRIVDGDGAPVPDALVETWQCDGDGRFDNPGFRGLGRCPTDADGRYRIRTVKPAAPGDDGDGARQAPHIDVSVFARGLLDRVVTRIYFADEPEANAADPVLSTVDAERRATLVAERVPDGTHRFDIRLRADGQAPPGAAPTSYADAETVFFDV
jgi:protocatechuate 3,4-dioxygenase, alpha subunit